MIGSITNNAALYKKKTFIHVPPAPPADLIDCSNFILDFADRKFLNVGFDSEDKFNIVIHIITPSRYVSIYEGFLRRIFSLMGNILSFLLDVPQKCRKQIFLEDEFTAISNMVYRGESVLVIESKKKEGCRVLLDRKSLLKLQYIEESIFETIARKSPIIRSVPAENVCSTKISRKCLRWSRGMSPELFVDPISPLSPPSPPIIMAPKKYSSPSPQYNDDNDAQPPPTKPWDITPRQLFSPLPSPPLVVINNHSTGHDSDNFTQHPLWYNNSIKTTSTSPAVDENDGPTSFNNSPSILGEWLIHETVARMSTIIRPVVLKQFEIIGNYIDREFTNGLGESSENYRTPKLVEQRLRWSREISPELFVDPISSLSPPIIPKKYSSPSPQYNDDNDAQPPPTKP
ncbi:Uncharacterized protein FWK35_00003043 [Aphis craccivora]|uniref:Uncharacterized protein n=1 Tax=Aphis craccivora TaxID=307492 RepID=A0A6G0ZJG0_APHCR|nr:Uncharacterized protein FWK35_00003043 [Aphis craccivora]